MLLAGILLLLSAAAVAANFALEPTRLELGGKHQAAIIMISNKSAEPLHLQIETMRWNMGAEGAWNLEPTDELIVNPQLFEIAGASESALRVGTLQPADGVERAYRIIIEEMPGENPGSEPDKVSIHMLTHVSVPVFVEPVKALPVLSISAAPIEGRHLKVKFNNDGNARVDPRQLVIHVWDNKHGEIFHKEQLFGYVLSASSLTLDLHLPASVCAQARSFTVQLESIPAFPENDIRQGIGACDASSSP